MCIDILEQNEEQRQLFTYVLKLKPLCKVCKWTFWTETTACKVLKGVNLHAKFKEHKYFSTSKADYAE